MIRGKGINLRTFKEDDLVQYIQLSNEILETGDYYPNVIRTMPQLKESFKQDGFWNTHDGRMLITDKEDRIIGVIAHFTTAHYMEGYEIGYQIFEGKNRGKGHMSEALKLYSALLFDMYPINRLQLCADENNIGSYRVAEKCGYQYEGYMRNVIYEHGNIRGAKLYSMIREESMNLMDLIKE